MKTFLKLFSVTILMLVGIFSVTLSANAQFDPIAEACKENPSAAVCEESKSVQPKNGADAENPITKTVNKVANIIAIAVGVISVIVIIVAGITMTLSQGEAGAIKSSKDAIIYAAVGLVVVAMARLIVMFVINNV